MGQIMVKLTEPLQHCGEILGARRKRKRPTDSKPTAEDGKGEVESPKKKKLLTTTQYIYQALFKEQKNSDIAVMALGKVWNLHKVYLCQSPYFYSMFNGSWKESAQDFVHIKIVDERVTLDALDAVFGSMYSDEIGIEPKAVISVLATATLFHLEGIIEKCAEVMIETINVETAIGYYEAACLYGCLNVKKSTFEWLLTNLLCIYNKYPKTLRQISVELMTELVSSADLYVMQTEFSIYTLLRMWVYLRIHPSYDPENTQQQKELQQRIFEQQTQDAEAGRATAENGDSAAGVDIVQSYFLGRKKSIFFLATPEGREYIKPFQTLRTQYLTNHHMDLKIVLSDNIIPKDWLHTHVLSHWNSILKVDHQPEEGPQNLDAETFYKNCMRCGRILLESGYQKWRWTGFNFGLDLILIADWRVLNLRRHHRNEHERLLSLQTKRQIMIRVCVTSINNQRQPTFTQKSEILSLNLEKNEEVTLMVMDNKLTHPLLISVNLLVVNPTNQSFKENIFQAEEINAAIPISEIGANCERATTPLNPGSAESDSGVHVVPVTPPNNNNNNNTRLAATVRPAVVTSAVSRVTTTVATPASSISSTSSTVSSDSG